MIFYKAAARDAGYTLYVQTQGQGDIQTTEAFNSGIFNHLFKDLQG